MKKNTKLNLNISKDDSNLNDFLFCWDKFDSRPNKITIHSNYSTNHFLKLFEDNLRNTFTEIIPVENEMIVNDKVLSEISDEIYLSYVIIDKNVESSIVSDVFFYYKDSNSLEKIQELINQIELCSVDYSEEETQKLNILSLSTNGLEIEPITNNIDNDNIDIYYSSKTFKSLSKMTKKIKKSNKGLSILYGERGTGKTSAINYISENIDRVTIFIPNNLIDQTLNNPDFRRFVKKYHKPVIVIDDCEMIFNEFFTKSNMIVNNLLQLIDGLATENITFITIFNVDDESEIDHTLLECNNLLDIVEFISLDKDEATNLSSHLSHNKKFKTDVNLIDIIKKKNTDTKTTFGF